MTPEQIEKISQDPEALPIFERLIRYKPSVWDEMRELETMPGTSFQNLDDDSQLLKRTGIM